VVLVGVVSIGKKKKKRETKKESILRMMCVHIVIVRKAIAGRTNDRDIGTAPYLLEET
jgi:hypothetical protein